MHHFLTQGRLLACEHAAAGGAGETARRGGGSSNLRLVTSFDEEEEEEEGDNNPLQPHIVLAALLAAAVHDVSHPGVSNAFLVATQEALALRYNDRSPLESMHAATAFEVMRTSRERDLLHGLRGELRTECRRVVIEMVLATDNAHHHEHLGALNNKLDGLGGVDAANAADQLAVLRVALHAADVGNPAKPQVGAPRRAQGRRSRMLRRVPLAPKGAALKRVPLVCARRAGGQPTSSGQA